MNTKHKFWILNGASTPAPETVSNLVAWYDADNAASITKDGSNRVARWDSRVGSYFMQQTGADSLKPIWTDGEVGGKPAIICDGVDDFLTGARMTEIQGVQGVTMFAVGKLLGMYQVATAGIRTGMTLNNSDSKSYVSVVNSVSAAANVATDASTVYGLGSMIFDGTQSTNATKLKFWYKTSAKTLDFNTYTVPTTTESNAGSLFDLGRFTTSTYVAHKCAEMIVYNKALSDDERATIESYLMAKYGF